MTGFRPDWLTAKPIAHRGLHDRAHGVIENTPTAALRAIEKRFAIECDVQLTRDLEAAVFHDFGLERLTSGTGLVAEHDLSELSGLAIKDSDDHIPGLQSFLDTINAQVPLIIEIKSLFDGDLRLANRVLDIMRGYSGPVAIKSFDPAVIAWLRAKMDEGTGPVCPLGIVSMADFSHSEWSMLSADQKLIVTQFLHLGETRPDFLSWHVESLPHAIPFLCRSGLNLPVMTWTVRNNDQVMRARQWADQIVFEGFLPQA